MNRKYLLFASALLMNQVVAAQTPYMNENYMPTDLIGSARYVGMGGALGALGADVSAGAANPAALGLYRRSDVSMAFSVLTQKEKPDLNADMTHMSFDQLGFVVSVPIMGRSVKYVNFGANYQKRANFNSSFIADNGQLNGLSQTQQMADILNHTPYSTPLADLMYYGCLVNPVYNRDGQGNVQLDEAGNPRYDYYDALEADQNNYDRVTEGGIAGYEFNMSMNIKDRAYVGFAIGVNDVDYYSYSTYREFGQIGNSFNEMLSGVEYYSLYNTQHVSGYGVNAKFGAILRPVANSPFRIGLAVETPTFYHLEYYSSYSIDSPMYEDENYNVLLEQDANGDFVYTNHQPEVDLATLHMRIVTPWKVRVSLGHTVGKYAAFGAEYEPPAYITNLWPLRIIVPRRLFQPCMSETLTLYLIAIPPRVSPDLTVCTTREEDMDTPRFIFSTLTGEKYTLSLYAYMLSSFSINGTVYSYGSLKTYGCSTPGIISCRYWELRLFIRDLSIPITSEI